MKAAMAFSAVLLVAFAACAQNMAPQATEQWEPVPPHVTPGATAAQAPSDAIVLFDGSSLDGWESVSGGAARWSLADGAMTVTPRTGDIRTRELFEDVQLHIEWRTPQLGPEFDGQDRGNSGVFFNELYEVQILDTLENVTYANGQAGSVYKQHIPLANPARPAGEWQTYDIIFTAPRFAENGDLVSPARVTVLFNGVLVQNNVTLGGGTTYIGPPSYQAHGPGAIRLQDHGHHVSFRNIWARRL